MTDGEAMVRVDALVGDGRHEEAAHLLIAQAGAGKSDALIQLALWRIAGDVVRRDLGAARALLRAAAASDDSAALLHACFLAGGTGGEPDWTEALAELARLAPRVQRAAIQLRLIDAMDLDRDGAPSRRPPTRVLADAPYALAAPAFLTRTECAYLIAVAEPQLQPSVVVDPVTGRMTPHPVRTSDAAMFGVFAEDVVVAAINRRIAALSATRADQGEPLQVLRYRPGGEYKPHMDALPAEPNQRILTVLVYLSDDYDGGETRFVRTGLSFRGRIGDALLFRNAAADGRPDPMALHAGLPVTRGVKYLASRWIRSERFTYPPPKPLLDL
jgi:prolyl 4-hydroxylase